MKTSWHKGKIATSDRAMTLVKGRAMPKMILEGQCLEKLGGICSGCWLLLTSKIRQQHMLNEKQELDFIFYLEKRKEEN